MKTFDYSTYLSPFTWRYGSNTMRTIWSEKHKRELWRKIWVELASAQHNEGLVTKDELDDLRAHQNDIDIDGAHEIEKEVKHDLMAEVKVYASQAKIGGGKIHLGATSMDIEDNADTVRELESLDIIESEIKVLLKEFAVKIDQYKNLVCMAYTHLQPAEPTTLGYRFAFYAQDLLFDYEFLQFVKKELKGKGLKGAVGTAASYTKLLNEEKAAEIEKKVMEKLGISAVDIASQTAPRKLEFLLSSLVSSIAQSLYKFAFDLRIMQSPGFFEWHEPFGTKQIGSSAMPFKRNPIKSEQICSLGRLVMALSQVAGQNAAHMLLERTLDDSANRRIYIPEQFLALDEMLKSTATIVKDMTVNEKQIKKNLTMHGPFAATESILMEGVKRGGNRQELHEVLRETALKAYETIQETGNNNLDELLMNDARITDLIPQQEVKTFLNPTEHIGLAIEKSERLAQKIRDEIS